MIKKILLGLLIMLLLVVVAVLIQSVPAEQNLVWQEGAKIERKIDTDRYNIDSMNAIWGKNKQLAEGIELQTLIALSRYPELKEAHISFEFANIGAALESTFNIPTLLRNAKHREYRILFSDSKDSRYSFFLIQNLPFDSQVAILAHELGHTMYYHKLNLFQLGKWGVQYALKDGYSSKHEQSTDALPIYRGLGWQMYDYATFVRTDSSAVELYKEFGEWYDKSYLHYDLVMEHIKKIEEYEVSK